MFCFRIGHATAQPSATSAKVNPMRNANQNKWRLLPTAVGRARQNGELMSSIIWMLDKRLSSAIISSKLPRCHTPAYHKMAKGITSKHNINWIGLVRIQSHRETNTSKPPASPTSRTSLASFYFGRQRTDVISSRFELMSTRHSLPCRQSPNKTTPNVRFFESVNSTYVKSGPG